ncbi:TonB-dependent receptor [Kineobactrum salinum]|uniref:TonB-dependent receptor n=1 Tax=Kineobactrum salinum TaxID=2708301 RepID=A0A6C0TYK9_9GAMM|nr:TonB-dependent receptor [Kineobactrum salinum]QIB64922.1 TonB-dependent receptor [Kineobactrum salinum]
MLYLHLRVKILGLNALRSLPILAAPFIAAASHGQEDAGPRMLEEIVVTAERRTSSLQDTSMAVSALTGEAMSNRGINDVEALAFAIPNMSFGESVGNARIAIRGIGFDNISVGNEGRVAFHMDGVYVGRPAAALGTLFDIERVEVLRGPQGTLYGRNATGGSINVVTRGPNSDLPGYIRARTGNYDLRELEAATSASLTDEVSGRVAVKVIERDGYGTNLVNGRQIDDERSRSIRGKLLITPTAALEVALTADYRRENDHNYGYHFLGAGSPERVPTGLLLGGEVADDIRDVAVDTGPDNKRKMSGLAAQVTYSTGWGELVSVSAYRHTRYDTITDLDATSAPLTRYEQKEESDQYSQELRAQGDLGNSHWLLGAYYYQEDLYGYSKVPIDRALVGLPSLYVAGYFAGGDMETRAGAVFGQVDWNLTDTLSLTLGARYSVEEKRVDEDYQFDLLRPYSPGQALIPSATNRDKETWKDFGPRAVLTYEPDDNLRVYASVSQGFKSGGFNLGGLQEPFDSETLTSYELGLKAHWWQHRLLTNFAIFHYDYEDLQVSKVQEAVIVIENAAKASLQGIEVEVSAILTDQLQIDFNLGLLDTEFDEFSTFDPARTSLGLLDLAGNELTQAPRYTANLGVEYEWSAGAGTVTARAEGHWFDEVYFTPFNTGNMRQDGGRRYNFFLNYRSEASGWHVGAFIRNLSNEDHLSTALVGSVLTGSPALGGVKPPRTYGVTIGYDL